MNEPAVDHARFRQLPGHSPPGACVVAAMHDGQLDWRPNTPQGSVFRLLLPQASPD